MLLKEMSAQLPEVLPCPVTVLVLPRMKLCEVVNFCGRLDPDANYIVVGHSQARSLMDCGRTLKIRAFINIGQPLPELSLALHRALTAPFPGQNEWRANHSTQ